MKVGAQTQNVVVLVIICFIGVLAYTAIVFSKADDAPTQRTPFGQDPFDMRDIPGLSSLVASPTVPDLPEISITQGSRPLSLKLDKMLGKGASLRKISNDNTKITVDVKGNQLTISFDPFYAGSSELEFIIDRPGLPDPVVKKMKIEVTEHKGALGSEFTPSSEKKDKRIAELDFSPQESEDEEVDWIHDCLPPYFPDEPLKRNKLKLCHPDWIDGNSFYSKCEDDPTCEKCMKTHHLQKANTLLRAIDDAREEMHNELFSIFAEGGVSRNSTIMVTMLNKGYFYHWANFVCAVDKYKIPVRNYTLVIVFDDDSYARATDAGFMVYEPKWIPMKIDEHAASSFALGPHGVIMVFEHMMRNELVHMGYDVMFQDTDIVWRRDPMPWLMKTHPRIDVQVMYDGRTDGVGPINSGFIYTRSNCRTKIYLQTMIDNIVFFLWDRASQPFVNALMHHRKFRQISMRLLDVDLFMNGNRWTPEKPPDNYDELDPIVMHASWTGNHLDKIDKWSQVDEWHLTPECKLWDDAIFEPEVCKRLKDKLGFECNPGASKKESRRQRRSRLRQEILGKEKD